MMLTKGAIGNLINRYSAVLKKCRLMNTFGSLAVASMLVMGGAGVAGAEDIKFDSDYSGYMSITSDDYSIDLNGFKLSLDESNARTFPLGVTGKLTILDSKQSGEIVGKDFSAVVTSTTGELIVTGGNFVDGVTGIQVQQGASANISGGTVVGKNTGIRVLNIGQQETAKLTVSGDTVIKTTSENLKDVPVGIFLQPDTENKSSVELDVEGGTIYGYAYGISGNGTKHGTNINITGGKISSEATAIYHPQDGTMNISGGEITGGETGIEVRSGKITITGGTITGKGDPFAADPNGNGTTTTGAALAISQHTTNKDIDVKIEGGTFTGVNALFMGDMQDSQSDNINVRVSGGTFNGRIYNLNIDNFIMSGGTLAGGNEASNGGQLETYGISTISNVAFAGNTAEKNGGAIYNSTNKWENTFKDSEGKFLTVTAGKGILNLADVTLTGNKAGENGGAIYNSGNLTLTGTNTFSGNTAGSAGNDIYNAGSITIASGTTTLGSYGDKAAFVQAETGASLILNGGTLMADAKDFLDLQTGEITVKDVTVEETTQKIATTVAGISDESVIGTKGNLNLRADGLTYTSDQYTAVKNALFGEKDKDGKNIEGAVLTFMGANLDLQSGEQVVAGVNSSGDLTSGSVLSSSDEAVNGQVVNDTNQDVSLKNGEDLFAGGTISTEGNDITAKSLVIGGTGESDSFTLDVTGGSSVTLVGTGEDGSTGVVRTDVEGTRHNVATNVTVKTGTLNMGAAGNGNNQGLTLASATVNGGTLNANGGTGQSNHKIGTLELDDGTLNALNSSLIIENLKALKGTLFIDPAYVKLQDGATADEDYIQVDSEGKVIVGSGSVLETGTVAGAQAAAQEMGFNPTALSTGFTVAKDKAVLALGKQMQVTGGLVVDGKRTTTNPGTAPEAGTAIFADNSLLVVDGNIANGEEAALTATKVTVAEKAKLYVTNAKVGTYTIAEATTFEGLNEEDRGWKNANLGTDNKLVKAELVVADNTATVTTTANDAKSLMPGLDSELGALVNNMTNAGMTNQDSNNFGERFVNRAVNRLSGDAAAKTIEGAAKMAFAGAVPQMAAAVANSAASVATTRTSLASPLQDMGGAVAMTDEGVQLEGLSAGDGMKNGFGMWIMPMYQNQSAFGFDSGNFESGYKASFGGIALGADYTVNDAFRFGLSFNVGTGYADSTGDFNDTTNKFNYWGVGAYAGYKYGNFGLTADLGYTTTQNELEQDVPAALGMNKLEADTTATNLSAGLRGEYKVETSVLDIIPHVGVRVNSLHVKSFDVESAGRKVMKADDMNATVWQFPVGVTFSKDVKTDNGWTVRPQADLAVIPAAGDLEARQDVRLNGVPGSAEMDSNIMDSISGRASIGLEAKHDNGFSVGVNYSFQGSEHTADHGVQATFRYDF